MKKWFRAGERFFEGIQVASSDIEVTIAYADTDFSLLPEEVFNSLEEAVEAYKKPLLEAQMRLTILRDWLLSQRHAVATELAVVNAKLEALK